LVNNLVTQSQASQHTPTHFVARHVTVPKTYIVCVEDGAIPAAAQRAWAQETSCKTVEIESDHSPFLRHATNTMVLDVIMDVARS
jgi:hypothetical protein